MIKKITATIRDWFSHLVRSGLFKSDTTDEISPSILRGETASKNSDGNDIPQQPESGDQVVNPGAEPSDGHSRKVDSGGCDDETESDSCYTTDGQDNSSETPVHQIDRPTANDESAEFGDVTESWQYPQTFTESEQDIPSSDDSLSELSADPPKDFVQKPDSPSAHRTEETAITPQSGSSNIGNDSSEDSSKRAEEPESTEPRQIGGRRPRPTRNQPSPKENPGARPQFTPRPELICRKVPGSWQWEVVLLAAEECRIKEVRHGGESLVPTNGEYRLSSLAGELSIDYEDRKQDKFPLFDGRPMVFKSRNDWRGDGRRVSGITSGHYIVITPKEWKRTGRAPVEQEGCADTDFMAHYFYLRKGESEGDIDRFEGYELPLTESGFELTGDRVFDDSKDGELFVGAPPRLLPASGIVWARIGEEKEGGWKGENFEPAARSLADVLQGREGRFFVRVYDDDAKLLDSGEFRYLRNLREIRVNDELYSADTLLVPPSAGHTSTQVKFIGVGDAAIRPILPTEITHALVGQGDVLIVAPLPEGDDISCTLTSGTSRVDIVIKLPRIWWRMERDEGESDEWRDTPLAMTRQEFRKYAETGAEIRLRLPPRITSIKSGFDEEVDRVYRLSSKGAETEIPLADFVDYSQIDRKSYEDASFKVLCEEAALTLIRINADPVPTIVSFTSEPTVVAKGEAATLYWVTRNTESDDVAIVPGIGSVESSGCMLVAPAETTTYTLTLTASGRDNVAKDLVLTVHSRPLTGERPVAHAKRTGGGWRQGKGFSRAEIRAAGLTDTDAARRSISIDKRRRSMHQDNIETIRRSIDA